MIKLSLIVRYFRGGRKFISITSFWAFVGLVIAVGCLVVSMGVVSGFQNTLRNTIVDVTSHVMISRSGALINNRGEFEDKISEIIGKDLVSFSPYVALEGVVAHKGKLSGVMLEGIDPESMKGTINLESRLANGILEFSSTDGVPQAVLGKELAENFKLKLGDSFKVVIPRAARYDRDTLEPKVQKFIVSGLVDLGRKDFNSRYIFCDVGVAQAFGDYGDGLSGYWIKLTDAALARSVSFKLTESFGHGYWVRDWRDINSNLFEAVELEKTIIFLVLMILVIAAAVNVVSALYAGVLRRYPDISVLKAMGASQSFIVQIFVGVGVLIGALGVLGGIVFGLLAALGFEWLQDSMPLIQSEVYKLDKIEVQILGWDIFMIFLVTMVICFLATLPPALKGAKMSAVEGLRYE